MNRSANTFTRSAIAAPIWLALGDAANFVFFALQGRATHDLPLGTSPIATVLSVIAPFAVPWFVIGAIAGAFRFKAGASMKRWLIRSALAWLVAGSVGLFLRAAILQRSFPLSFALVTLGFNGALLIGWRLVAGAITTYRARRA